MIKQFFKIGGVKTEKEFLAKYPTEASFFRQHPEAMALIEQSMPYMPSYSDMIMPQAMYGMSMGYGGYMPMAQGGMRVTDPPRREDYMDNEEQYQADMDAYLASVGMGTQTGYLALPQQNDFPDHETYSQAVDQYLANIQQQAYTSQAAPQGAMPVPAPSPYVPTNNFNLKDYSGDSIVDFLSTQGIPANFSSRKKIASNLGITNYRGTASQNKELMTLIKQNPNILANDFLSAVSENQNLKSTGKNKGQYTKSQLNNIDSELRKAGAAATKLYKSKTNNSGYQPSDYFSSPAYKEQIENFTPKSVYENAQFNQSSKEAVNKKGSSKVDPYLRIIENDPRSQANINSRKRKEFARNLAIGTLLPYAANSALAAATLRYLPYGLEALPYVTAASRHASRALPYATRALPQAAQKLLPFKGGGSTYNAGVWFKQGGMPCYECGGSFMDGGDIPNYMQDLTPMYNFGGYFPQAPRFASGGIHIDPSKRGTFTAAATKAGMGVQEFASKVLSAPEGRYSPAMRKKANFARNAAGWKKEEGGIVEGQIIDVTPDMLEQLQMGGYTFEILND